MALSRVTPSGWLDESGQTSRVTPFGWVQESQGAGGASPTVSLAATTASATFSGSAAAGATASRAAATANAAFSGSASSGSSAAVSATAANAVFSGSAIGNVAQGTLATPVLKNNTGTVLANETGVTVYVYTPSTGELVVKKTGQTTNGSGVLAVTDALIYAGTQYRIVVVLGSGAEGMDKVSAA